MSFFDTTAMGFLVPASKFSADDIPDLSGKIAIVTGANTGLGKLTAQHLLAHNATVYAACRSEEKAEKAIQEIKAATGKDDIHFLKLDLGDIAQSKRAGEEFCKTAKRLDILVNSAGVMFPPAGSKTSDGFELQYGTNVLGHFAFTEALAPLLASTGKSSPAGSVRLVWVSSSGHFAFTPNAGIDYASITDVARVSNRQHYGQSKLANIHLANEYAERLRDSGVVSVSLHPGNIATDLQRHSWWGKYVPLYGVDLGVLTQLCAATSPEITMADSGAYFVPWARKYHPSHPKANDAVAQKETWNFCETTVKRIVSA